MTRSKKSRSNILISSLLLIVILLILAATGYYVYKSNQQSVAILNAASKETEETVPVKSKSPSISVTDNWTQYNNQEGSFALKYPVSWVQPVNKKLCPSGLFDRAIYLGASTSSVLKCSLNPYPGQISVISYVGDQRNKYTLSGTGYLDIKTVSALSGDISGLKTSATLASAVPSQNLVRATFIERYIFFTSGNTYVAQYLQAPTGTSSSQNQNVLSDFELMVTRTLQFN